MVSRTIDIPDGVKISLEARKINISGVKGTLKKKFTHSLFEGKLNKKSRNLKIRIWLGNKKQISRLNTITSHILNMIFGVTYGYQYNMKMVYAHFPINLTTILEGKGVEIRNFLGERRVRRVLMAQGVVCKKIETEKDEIAVSGLDINLVSLSASLIQQSCLIKNKDIRKFLDGVYVVKKGRVV